MLAVINCKECDQFICMTSFNPTDVGAFRNLVFFMKQHRKEFSHTLVKLELKLEDPDIKGENNHG